MARYLLGCNDSSPKVRIDDGQNKATKRFTNLKGLSQMIHLFSILLATLSTHALACEIEITKTMHDRLAGPGLGCINQYFESRNLAEISLGENEHNGTPYLFKDPMDMTFDEHILFRLPSNSGPLGKDARKAIAQSIYRSYLSTLKFNGQSCQLQLFAGDNVLGLEDFSDFERSLSDQPGSRIMLTKDDVSNPSWKLICGNMGQEKIVKEGKYFFLFVDVYENTNPLKLKDHLSYYLFSLR